MAINADLPSPDNRDSGQKEYSPFHRDFDKKFPIESLLNREERDVVASEKVKPLSWVSVFRGSPLNSSEAEMIMGNFVTMAVKIGQWIDIPVVEDESLEAKYELPGGMGVDFGELRLEFGKATELMEKEQYLKRVADDKKRV